VDTKVLKVLLLLGSNSEDATSVLGEARAALAARMPVLKAGSLWRTAAWGFEGPDFVNQVLEVEWQSKLEALLLVALEVERELGRVRAAAGPRYASRRIDIDLLLAQPFTAVATPRLELPHPRMAQRRFVLEPAAEFWSGWQADRSGRTLAELKASCEDQNTVHLFSNSTKNDL
jgi:2-amino-4-hydroxy-6-hydroxymethyldihydropteridine diphosphokinase